MAQDAPKAPAGKPAARARWNLSIVFAYVAAVALSASILGNYFFSTVPAHRRYLIDLRFRTLAIVSGQIKGRVESVGRALSYVGNIEQGSARKYYGALLPDLRFASCGAPGKPKCIAPLAQSGPALRFVADGGLQAEFAWTAVLQDSLQPFDDESEFTDFLVALESGEVVYQHGQSTPRITNLAGFFPSAKPQAAPENAGLSSLLQRLLPAEKKAAPEAAPPAPVSALPQHAQSIAITLNASPARLLLQPVAIETAHTLPGLGRVYVAGILDEHELERAAMAISPERVFWYTIPLVVLFLLLPFAKLWTLRIRERYSFSDVVLAASSVLGFAMVSVLCFFHYAASNPRTDDNLEQLAETMEHNISKELGQITGWLAAIDAARDEIQKQSRDCLAGVDKYPENLDGGAPLTKKGCNLWEAIAAAGPSAAGLLGAGRPDADVVFWSDEEGEQVRKWSTRNQLTAPFNGRNQPYFRDVLAGRFWHLKDGKPFVVQPLDSPTTAETAFVVSILGRKAGEDRRVLSVNVKPRSLVNALVPPEYGFAVIDAEGAVLFHSVHERSLRENFFEETDHSRVLREAAKSFRSDSLTAEYRGREHRMRIQPLSSVMGSTWRLVVFRDMEPVLRFASTQRMGAAAFLSLLWALLMAGLVGLWFHWHKKNRQSANSLMQFIWLDERRQRSYFITTTALGVLAVAILVLGFLTAERARYEHMSLLLFLCYLLPAAGIGVAIGSRWLEDHAPWSRWLYARPPAPGQAVGPRESIRLFLRQWILAGRASRPYRAQVAGLYAVLTLVVAVLPATGAMWVSYRLQDAVRTQRWLEQIARDFGERDQRLAAGLGQAAHYTPKTKEILASAPRPPRDPNTGSHGLHDYLFALRAARIDPHQDLAGGAKACPPPDARYRCFEPTWASGMLEMLSSLRWPRFWSPKYVAANLAQRGEVRSIVESDHHFYWRTAPGADPLTLRWCEAGIPGRPCQQWMMAAMTPPGLPTFDPFWVAIGIGLGLLGAGLMHFLIGELFLKEIGSTRIQELLPAGKDAPGLGKLIAGSRYNILFLGLPRSEKDRIVQGTIGGLPGSTHAPLRIRMQDAPLSTAWVRQQLALVKEWLEQFETTAGADETAWVHVSNLESGLNDQASRRHLLSLLEGIGEAPRRKARRLRIIATSSLDPILHFNETLSQEREDVYRDSFPELEMKRWALILSKFERCYVQRPLSLGLPRPAGAPDRQERPEWEQELIRECSGHRRMMHIGMEIYEELKSVEQSLAGQGDRIPRSLVRLRVMERSTAFYQLIWAACSRPEKLFLVQLAQSGVVNPKAGPTLLEMVRKGLVVLSPAPRIFNRTFHDYLRAVESPTVLATWESEGGQGAWQHAVRLAGLLIGIGLLFFTFTQGATFESVLPLLTTSGLITLPKIGQWVTRLAARGGDASDTQAA